jgi:DNA (cytosine-5)-methyltransferase 1
MKFIDLFAGLGGFHHALDGIGECVFASELDPNLRELYQQNFPSMKGRTFGDIRECVVNDLIPAHNLLCAGFPCQPFSKSGAQSGLNDKTRGTLFHSIVEILKRHRPMYLILENVGNFPRHDGGRTWKIVRETLESLGYTVRGTEHRSRPHQYDWRHAGDPLYADNPVKLKRVDLETSGEGLISPHHLGFPHHRERFFIVGSLNGLPDRVFPTLRSDHLTSLEDILDTTLGANDADETKISEKNLAVIEHWGEFMRRVPKSIEMPGFAIWGDEIDATYPFYGRAPANPKTLAKDIRPHVENRYPSMGHIRCKKDLLPLLPSYVQDDVEVLPFWKVRLIEKNRAWLESVRGYLPDSWVEKLHAMPPTHRKFEHNFKGGSRDIWSYVIQFRPSGLRIKDTRRSPALVAMTESQVPIYGPLRRYLTRTEGLRLQGLPDGFALPGRRAEAFRALGNGVHAGVVKAIAKSLLQNQLSGGNDGRTLRTAA